MPITPLHLGVIPVINIIARTRVSTKAFIIANILTDIPVLMYFYMAKVQEMGGPAVVGTPHSVVTHTFIGALVLGVLLSLFSIKSKAWWLGSLTGTLTHVLLDMFVHPDVAPFSPLTQWNPFYLESAHTALTVILTVGLAWFVVEWVDHTRAARLKIQRSPPEIPDEL